MVEFEVVGQKFSTVHVEAGVYPARLSSYEIRTLRVAGEEREVIVWTFEIDLEEETVEIEGMTSVKFSIGRKPSKAVQWVSALLGRELKPGDKIDLDELIGKECMVKVEDKKLSDGTVVSRVTDVIRKPGKKK